MEVKDTGQNSRPSVIIIIIKWKICREHQLSVVYEEMEGRYAPDLWPESIF